MRIGIIGGGFYGCHIAATAKSLGIDVTLFESGSRLLDLASGNNQFRLHQGFHYARSFVTRIQSRDGFHRFKERYPTFSKPIARNLYGVVDDESYLDFRTYRGIMSSSGLDFSDEESAAQELHHVEGIISTHEEVLQTREMRHYFSDLLSKEIQLGTHVDIKDPEVHRDFDWIVDCTWGHSAPASGYYYEPTLLLYYECIDPALADWSLTLVDGPFWSMYQTENPGMFTLSSVPHTPLGEYSLPEDALRRLASLTAAELMDRRGLFEHQASRHYPSLKDRFKFADYQLSVKTKPIGRADHRHCEVRKAGNVIQVLSGKIDSVFYASSRVFELMEQGRNDAAE